MGDIHKESKFDFTPVGQELKKSREHAGMTREQLSSIVDKAPRHIQAIENEGQLPSIELLVQLLRIFDVSFDQFIFPSRLNERSSMRRHIDSLLDKLDDYDLMVIESTVNGIIKSKQKQMINQHKSII